MQYLVKTVLSAILLVGISEIAKRSSLLGGLLASLPLVSVLAMIWLYIDTQSPEKVAALSLSIFWMVIPSLSLFLILPYLLHRQVPFYLALVASCLGTGLVYYGATLLYGKLGVKI